MNSDLRPQLHGVWSSVSDAWAQHADFIDGTRQWRHRMASRGDGADSGRPGPRARLRSRRGDAGRRAALVDPGEVDRVGRRGRDGRRRRAPGPQPRLLTTCMAVASTSKTSPSPTRAFDVVYCRDGLQFALDPARAVTEIAPSRQARRAGGRRRRGPSATATRGSASCSTCWASSSASRCRLPASRARSRSATRPQLEALFVDAGFTDVSVEDCLCRCARRRSTVGGG